MNKTPTIHTYVREDGSRARRTHNMALGLIELREQLDPGTRRVKADDLRKFILARMQDQGLETPELTVGDKRGASDALGGHGLGIRTSTVGNERWVPMSTKNIDTARRYLTDPTSFTPIDGATLDEILAAASRLAETEVGFTADVETEAVHHE